MALAKVGLKALKCCLQMGTLLALALPLQAAQTEPFWNWASQRYMVKTAKAPAEVLIPYWDAWLMRPPQAGQPSFEQALEQALKQAAPAPRPLTAIGPKGWVYISKAQQMLYLKDGEVTLASWPVSTAKYSVSTPVGRFRVINMVSEPAYNGRHGYFASRDPQNPLGTRWLGLNVGHFRTGVPIGIHGTSEPGKIGQAVSDGCIRLRNADVETLFRVLKVGTPVVISNN